MKKNLHILSYARYYDLMKTSKSHKPKGKENVSLVYLYVVYNN